MASKLAQLKSNACQAKQYVATHGTAYYNQLLEQNKQYVQKPATVEKCNELSKKLLYTRLASIKQDRRMLRRTFPEILSPASILTVIIFSFLFQIGQSNENSQEVTCSTTCVAQNCNTIGIRYGKYCGVGWSGCPGEKPCDDLDACCKVHDDCVGQKGMNNVKCHQKFKRCIKKVQKSGKPGFSTICPVDVAVPTMDQGMDMAIMFSQFGNSKLEL